jgi:hypothetical protein
MLLARALFGLIQFALFGLLTAILALKRPYLTLDLWVRRSPHEVGVLSAVQAGNRLNAGWPNRGGWVFLRHAQSFQFSVIRFEQSAIF